MASLHALNSIAASSKPTEQTMERIEQSLEYRHTNSTTTLHYLASSFLLHVPSENIIYLGNVSREGTPIKLIRNIVTTHVILKLVAACSGRSRTRSSFYKHTRSKDTTFGFLQAEMLDILYLV